MTMTTETTIDELLVRFFSAQLEGVKGVRRERIDRVDKTLRRCLETEGYRVLTDGAHLRLEAERLLDPSYPFVSMTDAADLVVALTIFLGPEWLMNDPLDRRAQLTLIDKLTGLVLAHRLVDRYEYACPLLDIRCGIDRARSELRLAKQARGR